MNFLALEVYDPGVAHTMLLAGKQGWATCASRRSTPPNCSRSWPTAWWPRCGRTSPIRGPRCGSHKRRIVQPALAGEIRRALVPGGLWRIATDIEDYALHVHEVMDAMPGFENVGGLTVSLPTEHVGNGQRR